MSNELLILRCQLGGRTAFAELVHTWHSQVERYVQRMLATADTDDVTQEVRLAVFRGLPRLRQPDRFAPWLFTVARRTVTNKLRAEYARPEPADDTDPAGTGPGDGQPDRRATPAHDAAGSRPRPLHGPMTGQR